MFLKCRESKHEKYSVDYPGSDCSWLGFGTRDSLLIGRCILQEMFRTPNNPRRFSQKQVFRRRLDPCNTDLKHFNVISWLWIFIGALIMNAFNLRPQKNE